MVNASLPAGIVSAPPLNFSLRSTVSFRNNFEHFSPVACITNPTKNKVAYVDTGDHFYRHPIDRPEKWRDLLNQVTITDFNSIDVSTRRQTQVNVLSTSGATYS